MKMMKNKKFLLVFILILSAFIGCNKSESPSDTPTYGNITISVDETIKPLIESEIVTFSSIYQYADVKANYKPQEDAFSNLMNDSTRLIIVARPLNNSELEQFKRWEIVPKINIIAHDAVALIGSEDLKDSVITLGELKNLLSGSSTGAFKKTKVVFDNNNSSTISALKEKTGTQQLSADCYALNSSEAVLNYVEKEKNTIGVIGVNWISDNDDSTKQTFLKSVKVLGVAETDTSESFKPYQAYIALNKYPLSREIYVLSKEAYTGLGTGFTAFLASDRGQRIVLKFGLVPATMPVRLVELINENIKVVQ
jgi:phosphate transport system substrate-binding protein